MIIFRDLTCTNSQWPKLVVKYSVLHENLVPYRKKNGLNGEREAREKSAYPGYYLRQKVNILLYRANEDLCVGTNVALTTSDDSV